MQYLISFSHLMKFYIYHKKYVVFFNEILYVQPYSVLFGRIHIENNETKNNIKIENRPYLKEINEEFYRGFEME